MSVGKLTKKSLIFFLSFLVLISLLVSLCFFLSFKEERIKGLETQIKNLEEELTLLKSLPSPGISTQEEFKAGEIGEPETPEEKENAPSLLLLIVNTTAQVKEIKENGIIALGSGSNFVDQKPRELTLLFTRETLVGKIGSRNFQIGLEGLKELKPGMQILIEGDENIRGKTQFKIKTINIIK